MTSRPLTPDKPDDALRSHLLAQPIEWLVDQLLTASQSAPMLRARLEAGVGETPEVDISQILGRLDQAAEIGGYVHYRDAPTFTYKFAAELDAVDDLLSAGFCCCRRSGAGACDSSDRGSGWNRSTIPTVNWEASWPTPS